MANSKRLTKGDRDFVDCMASNAIDDLLDGLKHDDVPDHVMAAMFRKLAREASAKAKAYKAASERRGW